MRNSIFNFDFFKSFRNKDEAISNKLLQWMGKPKKIEMYFSASKISATCRRGRRMSPFTNYEYQFKVTVVGDMSVGKTSFLEMFSTNRVNNNYVSTIGIDFFTKMVNIEGENFRLKFWDTSGQERFRSLVPSYLRDAKGVLLMFDITDRNTFESLEPWLENIRGSCLNDPKVIIIGNKTDLEAKRQVTPEEAKRFAEQEGLDYREISTRNQEQVDAAAVHLAKELKVRFPNPPSSSHDPPKTTVAKKSDEKECCTIL